MILRDDWEHIESANEFMKGNDKNYQICALYEFKFSYTALLKNGMDCQDEV